MLGFKEKDKKNTEELNPSDITAAKASEIIDNDKKADSEVMETPPLTWKEAKALKRARYDKKHATYKKEFVLFNKKTGQIAEVRGVSSLQACGSIGWRFRNVAVIETKEVETEAEKNHTSSSSENAEVTEVV